ncbi:N-acetyl-alpha-D-glucosaminyl L-malate synthase BshA [Chlamydia trachomatis]|nr:N-acetyl-alpha-D-glucosaminyl L-malate synthase BshA [Chlamydia trachomatis]
MNGFLCETDNVDQIAESINKILSNKKLADEFSKNGLEIIKQHDLNFTITKFEEIYKKVVDKKSTEPKDWRSKLINRFKK